MIQVSVAQVENSLSVLSQGRHPLPGLSGLLVEHIVAVCHTALELCLFLLVSYVISGPFQLLVVALHLFFQGFQYDGA